MLLSFLSLMRCYFSCTSLFSVSQTEREVLGVSLGQLQRHLAPKSLVLPWNNAFGCKINQSEPADIQAITLGITLLLFYTESRKKRNLVYSIHMYWTNFWRPTIHVQQNIFVKTSIEVGSSHLYGSFGPFYVKIRHFLGAQWVFEKCLKTVKSLFLRKMRSISNSSKSLKSHCDSNTWPIWTQNVPKEA